MTVVYSCEVDVATIAAALAFHPEALMPLYKSGVEKITGDVMVTSTVT